MTNIVDKSSDVHFDIFHMVKLVNALNP